MMREREEARLAARQLRLVGQTRLVAGRALRQVVREPTSVIPAVFVPAFFYSVNLVRPLWFTLDYQHIWNPGYNADRGPVDIFGWRMHAEF